MLKSSCSIYFLKVGDKDRDLHSFQYKKDEDLVYLKRNNYFALSIYTLSTMVLNYIWIGFFVIAFIIALIKVIVLGDTEIFTAIMNATFDSSKTAFEISLGLTGVLALWLGIMKIGENSGLINALARFLSPVLCRLFPDIPKGHPVLGSIFMNMSANMLGLDNAATPLGLKAMKELQDLNPKRTLLPIR